MRFWDLGALELEVDGLPRPLGGQKPASILSLLLWRVGTTVTSDALIDAVWGDAAPSRATQSLESLVWRVRNVLEPDRLPRRGASLLRREEAGYRLVVPPEHVASSAFMAAAASLAGSTDRAEFDRVVEVSGTALELWRGRPFDGVPEAGWMVAARQHLIELCIDVHERRLEALLECGQPEQVVMESAPLLDEHPFRERLWALRMLGLYRSGRQAAALEAFSAVRQVLAEELALEPGPELQGLQLRILEQDPSLIPRSTVRTLPGSGPVQLPSRRSSLIGRECQVLAVRDAIGAARLVTLVGPGGVGKTRLAVEAAYQARATFPDGVWFVDLTEFGDGQELGAVVAGLMGLDPQPSSTALDVVVAHLAARRTLLVVDNCEHVVGQVAHFVDQLLDHCPGVVVLATSREPIGLSGEQQVSVAPLDLSTQGEVAVDESPAVALFVERVAAYRPDLDLAGSDGTSIASICAAVGGLPLGIELAAARARSFELEEIVATLAENPAQLSSGAPGSPRQASLFGTVEWSYQLARPAEQMLHRRLAVTGGSFTLDVARALCDSPPLRRDQAMDVLGGLVHRSLVVSSRPERRGRPTTFSQLPPIRAHAAAALGEGPERVSAEMARDGFMIERLRSAPVDGRAGQAAFYEWLDDNRGPLWATLRSVTRTDPRPVAVDVLRSVALYWNDTGRLVEGLDWVSAAVERLAGVLNEHEAASLCAVHAVMLALQHRADAGQPLIDQSLPVLLTAPPESEDGAAQLLVLLAASTWVGDRWEQAARLADAAVRLGGERNPHLAVRGQAIRAATMLFLGDVRSATNAASAVLEDNVTIGNSFATLFAAITMTVAALITGAADEGLSWSRRVLEAQRDLGVRNIGQSLESRGNLLVETGQLEEAVRAYACAAAQTRQAGGTWPWHPNTAARLARARTELAPADFERAWSSGQRLGASQTSQLYDEFL